MEKIVTESALKKTAKAIRDLIPGESELSYYTEITYEKLKLLRDNNELKAGCWYRITDYLTTTTETDTISAEWPFDILVLATSTNTLSEEARAMEHDGCDYFEECNLSAWKIWYCLDNDTDRFLWAAGSGGGTSSTPAVQGTGVIYRMIDEWGNEAPYDFKNILFKRWIYDNGENNPDCDGNSYFVYTFSDYDLEMAEVYDATVEMYSEKGICKNNKIGPRHIASSEVGEFVLKYALNNVVFLSIYDPDADFGYICKDNVLENSYNSTFGTGCVRNIVKNAYRINFGKNVEDNIIINGGDITIRNSSSENIIINSKNVTIGNNSGRIQIMYSHTIKLDHNWIHDITIYNSSNITLDKDNMKHITVKPNNSFIKLTSTTDPGSGSHYLRNIVIDSSIQQNDSVYHPVITIDHPTYDDTFITTYKNANDVTVTV